MSEHGKPPHGKLQGAQPGPSQDEAGQALARGYHHTPRLVDIDSISPDVAARATRIAFNTAEGAGRVTCTFGAEVLDKLFACLVENRHPGLPALGRDLHVVRAASASVATNPSGGAPLLVVRLASGIEFEVPVSAELRAQIDVAVDAAANGTAGAKVDTAARRR